MYYACNMNSGVYDSAETLKEFNETPNETKFCSSMVPEVTCGEPTVLLRCAVVI